MSGFYLREHGDTLGPYDEAALRLRLADGGLAWSTMSWRAGEARWTSLRRRWAKRGGGHVLPAACGWVLGVGLAALAVVAVAQLVALPEQLQGFGTRLGVAALAGVLAIAFAAWYWKASARGTGWPRLGAVLCALLVATGVACSLAAIGLQKRVSEDRASMPDARMVFDRASGELRIDGNIGEHFTRDLRTSLDGAPGLRRIVIDSPGGFVSDALDAGELLAERGVTVRVQRRCASACSVLWAAAPRREIAFEGRIGLHRAWLDVELPSMWRASVDDDIAERTGAVMKRAGFSDAMLAQQARTAPGDMYWIDPVELYEGGVQLIIVDAQGATLSGSRAKFLAAMLGTDAKAPVRKLVDAFVARLPLRADRLGPDLYDAWRQGDSERTSALSLQFSADAKLYALATASDAAVVAWGRSLQSQLAAATAGSDAAACRVLLGIPQPADIGRKDDGGIALALAGLVAAAPTETDPAPAHRVALDRTATMAIFGRAFRRKLAQGYPQRYESWPPLTRCGFMGETYAELLRQPQRQAAQAIRVAEGL
ncbi:MAG TPA: GYF domain-containing protein [Luteimonas sp.]|nr:GYF domain-containing protein [Luteimonas sp.]